MTAGHAWSILGGVGHAIQEHAVAALPQMEKQTIVDVLGAGFGLDPTDRLYFKCRAWLVARINQMVA